MEQLSLPLLLRWMQRVRAQEQGQSQMRQLQACQQ
jgi:hypothetical protein